jgi:hypothetical protein
VRQREKEKRRERKGKKEREKGKKFISLTPVSRQDATNEASNMLEAMVL